MDSKLLIAQQSDLDQMIQSSAGINLFLENNAFQVVSIV